MLVVPFLAWLSASSTLKLARRFACIGANAASAYGSSRAASGCLMLHGSIYGNSILAGQDHPHGR